MCVCVKQRSSPIADPNQRVATREGLGDVEFLVGEPAQQFVSSRAILSAASPVFHAMFYGPMSTQDFTIHLPDVEPRAFALLLRHCNQEEVTILSSMTALSTLYVADKYWLPQLTHICCQYLYDRLQPDIALSVFAHARQYSSAPPPSPTIGVVPSAPPEDDTPEEPPPGLAGWSAVLLSRCLDYIDLNAQEVLSQEEVDELERDALRELLVRDSLCCDELTVVTTVNRWAERECRRQHISPTPENRRRCLGDILYLVRFPLLTPDQFMRGPIQTELLTSEESKYFSSLCTGSIAPPAPAHLQRHLQRMMTPRVRQVVLVQPTPKNQEEQKKKIGWLKSKTKSEKADKATKKKKCTGSCFTNSLIDVLACIFD